MYLDAALEITTYQRAAASAKRERFEPATLFALTQMENERAPSASNNKASAARIYNAGLLQHTHFLPALTLVPRPGARAPEMQKLWVRACEIS
jgi:hypothetical protein